MMKNKFIVGVVLAGAMVIVAPGPSLADDVVLSWQHACVDLPGPAGDPVSGFKGFTLYKSQSAAGPYAKVKDIPGCVLSTTETITTTTFFRVTASDLALNESGVSNTAQKDIALVVFKQVIAPDSSIWQLVDSTPPYRVMRNGVWMGNAKATDIRVANDRVEIFGEDLKWHYWNGIGWPLVPAADNTPPAAPANLE